MAVPNGIVTLERIAATSTTEKIIPTLSVGIIINTVTIDDVVVYSTIMVIVTIRAVDNCHNLLTP